MKFFSKFKISMNPDRMNYQKNSFSYILCLLALLLDILSLSSIFGYPPNIKPDFRSGVDIVCHIIFLMLCFMIAEKTKRYSKLWAYIAGAAGLFQISKIFIFIMPYHKQGLMTKTVFALNIVYLSVCAACLIGAGILCCIRSALLEKHLKTKELEVDNGKITAARP